MAISSKKSQGSNNMYVQSKQKGGSGPARGGISSIKATFPKKGQNTSDAINISAGDDFYEVYADETIEAALATRGVSQLRPEIIGSFEFIPPLNADSSNLSQADGQVIYNSSASGELIDMQNQLKQLRYAEALKFIEERLSMATAAADTAGGSEYNLLYGSEPEESDSGTVAATAASATEAQALLDDFVSEMETAGNILDFIAASLTIKDLKTAISIKTNNYNGSDNSTTGDGIAGILSRYDDDFVQNKITGIMSLESYLKDYLSAPEDWWENCSNTAIVMQLLADAFAKTTVPSSTMSNLPNLVDNFLGGTVPGASKDQSAYTTVEQLGKFDLKGLIPQTITQSWVLVDAEGGSSTSGTTYPPIIDVDTVGSSMFTRGDFLGLWDTIVSGKDPTVFYIACRDYINHCQSLGSGDSGDVTERLKHKLGWDPFTPYDNLASISRANGDSFGIDALRPSIGDDSNVANFNLGGGDTPHGVSSIKPGAEYYVDEFFSLSIDESLEKIAGLASSLGSSVDGMYDYLKDSFNKSSMQTSGLATNWVSLDGTERELSVAIPVQQNGTGDLSSADTIPGIEATGMSASSTAQGNISASEFTQRLFEEITTDLDKWWRQYVIDWGTIGDGNWYDDCRAANGLFMIAASQDPSIAWECLKYFLIRDRHSIVNGGSSQGGESDMTATWGNTWPDVAREHGSTWSQKILDFFGASDGVDTEGGTTEVKYYGFGYDDDSVPYEGDGNYFLDSEIVEFGEVSCDYGGPWFQSISLSAYDLPVTFGEYITQTWSDPSTQIEDFSESPMDSISRAVDHWEARVRKGYGVSGDIDDIYNDKTDGLGVDRTGRLILGYIFFLAMIQQTQKFAIYVPAGGALEGTENSYTGATSTIIWSASKRAIASLMDANEQKNSSPSSQSSTNLGTEYGNFDGSTAWDYTTGDGNREAISESISFYYTYVIPQLEWDISAWNSFSFVSEICNQVIATCNNILSIFSQNDLSESSLAGALEEIQSNSDIESLVLSTIVEDQVRISRFLYESFNQSNRDTPYLPASKAVMSNQAKNLGLMCQAPSWLETETSGRKRIFAIGLPTGMMEFLRDSASSELTDSRFDQSNVVKISLWRRNLLDESVPSSTQEYIFDVSKFIVEGRIGEGQNDFYVDDAAHHYEEGNTLDDLLESITVQKIGRFGVEEVILGHAYSLDTITNFVESGAISGQNLVDIMGDAPVTIETGEDNTANALKQIFNNTAVDFYLKLYLLLTTGIDVREDVFCFAHEETYIPEQTPDDDKVAVFSALKKLLESEFPDPDDLAQGITYQRILGELTRSLILSPKKYRNRIVYPKIFDRVFCILIDDNDWVTSTSQETEPPVDENGLPIYEDVQDDSTVAVSANDTPMYYQYYVTTSLMTEVDPEEGNVLNFSS